MVVAKTASPFVVSCQIFHPDKKLLTFEQRSATQKMWAAFHENKTKTSTTFFQEKDRCDEPKTNKMSQYRGPT